MLAALRTRRWQGFTVVVLVAIIGFGFLESLAVAASRRKSGWPSRHRPWPSRLLWFRRPTKRFGIHCGHPYRPIRHGLCAVCPSTSLGGRNGFWSCSYCKPNSVTFGFFEGGCPRALAPTPLRTSPHRRARSRSTGSFVRSPTEMHSPTVAAFPPTKSPTSHPRNFPGRATLPGTSKPNNRYLKTPSRSCRSLGRMNFKTSRTPCSGCSLRPWPSGGWFYFLRREAKELD